MIRRILAPLDPSLYGKAVIDYACFLAAGHRTEVTGVVVLDIPEITRSVGPVAPGGMYWAKRFEAAKINDAKEHVEVMLSEFKQHCSEKNIKHIEAEVQGSPSEQVLFESTFYDLVVMGLRTNFHFETDPRYGNSLEKIIQQSITPILAVPKKFKPIEKVLIAFDGSFPAARAMKRFAHLASGFNFEINILMAGSDEETAQYYLDYAEKYLRAYNVKNIKKTYTDKDLRKVLEEKYMDWADLIVTGLHSKHSIKEIFVGSHTKYLIREANKPLFIGQ